MRDLIVHLEVYIIDPATNGMVDMWRHSIFDVSMTAAGTRFLLHSKERAGVQSVKWIFPEGCIAKGEHYDTRLDAYVQWATFPPNPDFSPFGFVRLTQDRWP